jgi:hypothetical protein
MKRLLKGTLGSFTIESSLIFPLIFMVTLILIFGSLIFYQKAGLYYTASTLVDRTAYVWDNSYKDPYTGSFEPGQNDGLYWRISNDSVSDMFGFAVQNTPMVLQFPGQLSEEGLNLPLKKLQIGANQLSEGISGTLTYTNHWFDRRIKVKLQSWLHLPSFAESYISDQIYVEADSGVVDPVEFIRSIDLVNTYAKELRDRGIRKQAAKDALDEFLELKSPASFDIHRQAHNYLQLLVNGREIHLETSHGVRRVDAFDGQGVSHQAYLTFNEKNIRLQLAKDAELLTNGNKVGGVVWHFFRKTNQKGRVGPSEQLRADIESKGIVVIIHD